MPRSLILIFGFILFFNSIQAQNDKYIKLDLIQLPYGFPRVAFETRNEKSGLEIAIRYDYMDIYVNSFPEYDLMTMAWINDFESYGFNNNQINLTVSYKRYLAFLKRSDRAYIGAFLKNGILLNRDDAYYDKYEEINDFKRRKTKTLHSIVLGPTVGLSYPLGKNWRLEIGIGIGIDLATSFGEFGGIDLDGILPLLIGYKF